MTNFNINMELPVNYVLILQRVAEENKMSADQFARNIIANFIRKNYNNLLTQN